MKNYSLILLIAVAFFFPLSLTHAAVTGDFDKDSYSLAPTKKATFSGGATDVSSVRITVQNEHGKVVTKGKETKVKSGAWKTRLSKKLPAGEYEVLLFGKVKGKQQELASTTLSVTKKGTATETLSASMLPLLMGGLATSGASIPVAYIKLYNSGTASTSIKGFTLAETGSAPDSIVTGFATNDDKGGSRTITSATFTKGSAFVPLDATLAPGQIRIFTVKAQLAKGSSGAAASQLKINVASIETEANVTGKLPLIGTTFTLGF